MARGGGMGIYELRYRGLRYLTLPYNTSHSTPLHYFTPHDNAGKWHIPHLAARNARYDYILAGTMLEAVEFGKDVGMLVH